MFKQILSGRSLAMTLSIMGLFVCTGSGPMADDGGCDIDFGDAMDGADVIDGFLNSPVTPNGTGGPAAQPTAPSITVGASATEVDAGTDATFVVTITGGTGPYYVYWFLEGDNGWTLGGDSATRRIDGNPGQTRLMYCQVIDSNNLNSNQFTVPVLIRSAAADACPSIAGRYNTVQGWLRILDYGNGDFAGYYGTGVGDQTVIVGEINGGFTTVGAAGCPDCVVLSARWSDGIIAGDIAFTFSPNRKTFNGKWSYDGESHWQASPWDGYRDSCN